MKSTRPPLLQADRSGLWCEAGGFHIDPWEPVPKALITHAHSDHARPGSGNYLCAFPSELILRYRLGEDAPIEAIRYAEPVIIGGVHVSFHPAGHILGSSQIRVEHDGEVWVVSGDYKLAPDPTAAPFELLRCNTFVTESTFGLPIYRWHDPAQVIREIEDWWRANQERGRCSVLFAYPLGKSQRILASIEASIGPIHCHGSVENVNAVYRASGITLPNTQYEGKEAKEWTRALVLAPPSAQGTPWMKRFGAASTAYASGWMCIRGKRRYKSIDRGFVLSDHADWPALLRTINETGAERVFVSHGYRGPLVRWLEEQGREASALETPYEREGEAE